MRIVTLLGAFLASLSVTACESGTVPNREPGMEGVIVGIGEEVPWARGSATRIWVKEDPEQECGIVFSTDEAMVLERFSNRAVRHRTPGDLEVGQRVKLWFDLVLESCPGQSGAEFIEILP